MTLKLLEQLKRLDLAPGKREGKGHRMTLWLHGPANLVERAKYLFGQLGYRENTESRQDFSAIRYEDATAAIRIHNVRGLIDLLREHLVITAAAELKKYHTSKADMMPAEYNGAIH